MRWIITLVCVASLLSGEICVAQAKAPAAPQAPEATANATPDLVLLPRALAETISEWMRAPDPTTAINLWLQLTLCIADNPKDGRVVRLGPDRCPAVTKAVSDMEALRKKTAAAVAKPTK